MMKKANTAIYIPNMDADKFEKICNEKGLQFVYVPVPPHGDLIDRDAARGSIKPWSPEDEMNGCTFDTVKKLMYTMLDRAPTIIPAEEEQL